MAETHTDSMHDRIVSFYKKRKVLITGHNGFKGSWMCKILTDIGADVCGLSLPCEDDSPYRAMELDKVRSIVGDVGNTEETTDAVSSFEPEVIIHMAAQPLVLESYKDPVLTYRTNVMGTVNILDAARKCGSVISVVNVTTDKVYKNTERAEGYREDEVLDGHDPYSNSKSCSELVTASYKRSFFDSVQVSTCRAGNVIGGGDRSKHRIVPDCVRAAELGKTIILRNPNSVRPYQHVLEPVCAYLLLAAEQVGNKELAGSYNIGPEEESTITTQRLAQLFCDNWEGAKWKAVDKTKGPHEAGSLRLNIDKFKGIFDWRPKWDVEEAIKRTVEWHLAERDEKDMAAFTAKQIECYLR
ncbi:MAG: CDP-glucose 4,6-dehydratase [Methanomassiliicoccaceae archaeon]|jgi:CDP-glucose 4,6-dehydratase|nr:CDP-glucose 4,6-dehydratase [Methanomassiliicoccaceae archaeon]